MILTSQAGRVCACPLMLSHARSKGLEWARVYLVRCNAGEMPLTGCVGAEVCGMQLEEERRLCYVSQAAC